MIRRGPKIIAVIGMTRAQVESGIAHAKTSGSALPVWAWCAEPAEQGGAFGGCERFVSGVGVADLASDLRGVWPALSIVAWTGDSKAFALKLLPLFTPPFRVVAFNEAGGFFAVRPASLLNHAGRRAKDAGLGGVRRMSDRSRSLIYRSGERLRDVATWVRSVGLAGLAIAAKPTAPIARGVMRKTARVRMPGALLKPAHGVECIELPLPGRWWPRQTVLRALESSSADFVVFRAARERSPAQPLVVMARETNAFAVTRQIAWAGWRDTVLHRHPFGVLRKGEVTAVEAPHSTLTVIRLDMLRQFGVPRAMTSGAALMQLFWKAAAEGLTSLAVGDDAPVTQEPAMELEDAEFILRKPAGAGAESARGNVAWSPFHRRELRHRPRVLVVSPYLPYPLAHGGAVRIYNLCRTLADEVDFVLACFRESTETVPYAELHEIFREVFVVDVDEKQTGPEAPAQVSGYRNSAMARLIEERCASGEIDLLQLEYTQMAEYGGYASGVPTILVEHDITFTLYRQFGNLTHYRLWRAFERKALAAASAVWTMSARDRAVAIRHGAPRESTFAIPNGVDPARFRPGPKQRREPVILFVGSFRHPPNLLAFEALRDNIMPAVWEACPDARLHVISGPHSIQVGPLDKRIDMEGFVADVRPAYRDCDVVAVPLPVSAGTNIKVMEAMACGRPIVSTALGCQGLDLEDGQELLIREIGPEFSEALTALLQDAGLRRRMGERGRETAERRFDWQEIAREAMRSYEQLLGARASLRQARS